MLVYCKGLWKSAQFMFCLIMVVFHGQIILDLNNKMYLYSTFNFDRNHGGRFKIRSFNPTRPGVWKTYEGLGGGIRTPRKLVKKLNTKLNTFCYKNWVPISKIDRDFQYFEL
jgi:hypothetical protein